MTLTPKSTQSFCLLCAFVHLILCYNDIIAFFQSSLRPVLTVLLVLDHVLDIRTTIQLINYAA